MSVTPFVPTVRTGPAPASQPGKGSQSGKAGQTGNAGNAGQAGKAGKADGADKPAPGETETTTDDQTVGDFLATLSTALAAVAQPVSVAADGSVPTAAGSAESDSTQAGGATSTLLAAWPGTVAAAAPDAGAVGTPSTGSTGQAAAGAALVGALPAGGEQSTLPAQQAVDSSPLPGGQQSATPTPPAVAGSPLAGTGPAGANTGGEQATAATAQTVAVPPLPGGRSADTGSDREQATAPAPQTVDSSSLPVAPVASADGSSATSVSLAGSPVVGADPRTAAGDKTTAVLRQVFPEITRLATQPGAHRLSITLHPDTLGEVKVTLVVRAGTVQVDLTAGTGAARDALAQGASELHRLLGVTGGDARVVVRDASSTASTTTTTTTADQRGADGRGQQSSYAPGADRDPRDPDRGARTTTDRSVDEPISPRGVRPGSPTSANPAGTAVHPGRLDRLM